MLGPIETTAVVWHVLDFDDERDEISAYLRMEGVIEVGGEEPAVTEMISIQWIEPKQGRRVQDTVEVTLRPSQIGIMITPGRSALN